MNKSKRNGPGNGYAVPILICVLTIFFLTVGLDGQGKPFNPLSLPTPGSPGSIHKTANAAEPYSPVNKLQQVFKNGYPKKTVLTGTFQFTNNAAELYKGTRTPEEREYIVDEKNNLVQILVNGQTEALFEYGCFFDSMGNNYQVKFTYNNLDPYSPQTTIYLCMLNDDEMIVDQFNPDGNGMFYEYDNQHLYKITKYKIEDGRKIANDNPWVVFERDSNLLMQINWATSGRDECTDKFKYNKRALVENRWGLLPPSRPYFPQERLKALYMAGLLGFPMEYLPYGCEGDEGFFMYDYWIDNLEVNDDGFPESMDYTLVENITHINGCFNFYHMEYVWGDVSSVDELSTDTTPEFPVEIFTLDGLPVHGNVDTLEPGIYIMRQGYTVKKVAVK